MEIKEKKREIKLNEKEQLILQYIAGGYSDKEIAEQMGYAYGSIRRFVFGMLAKAGVFNRVSLVAWGFRNKYLK